MLIDIEKIMLDESRTIVFWIGLIVLSLGVLTLFSIFWALIFYGSFSYYRALISHVPFIVSGVVFTIIGFLMMRSERKKK
jgi:hypothetical protein